MVEVTSLSPDMTFQKLVKGNNRWMRGKNIVKPTQEAARSQSLSTGQNPDTVIITCSDSRVIPEFIFDTTLSELFVIRIAGNVITPEVLASVEFAVEELKSNLVIILGHQNCGAVQGKIQLQQSEVGLEHIESPNMKNLMEKIVIQYGADSNYQVEEGVKANAIHQRYQLLNQSQLLNRLLDQGRIRVLTGLYWIETGSVEFL